MDVLERKETENQSFGEAENQVTCVMKFGGSSVASAERMREVAELILSFPNERPIIVLSAMGKTTNKLLLVWYIYTFRVLVMFPFVEGSFLVHYSVSIEHQILVCVLSGRRKGR